MALSVGYFFEVKENLKKHALSLNNIDDDYESLAGHINNELIAKYDDLVQEWDNYDEMEVDEAKAILSDGHTTMLRELNRLLMLGLNSKKIIDYHAGCLGMVK